jgi:hypothetical protein
VSAYGRIGVNTKIGVATRQRKMRCIGAAKGWDQYGATWIPGASEVVPCEPRHTDTTRGPAPGFSAAYCLPLTACERLSESSNSATRIRVIQNVKGIGKRPRSGHELFNSRSDLLS